MRLEGQSSYSLTELGKHISHPSFYTFVLSETATYLYNGDCAAVS